jgi:hypothetical protein
VIYPGRNRKVPSSPAAHVAAGPRAPSRRVKVVRRRWRVGGGSVATPRPIGTGSGASGGGSRTDEPAQGEGWPSSHSTPAQRSSPMVTTRPAVQTAQPALVLHEQAQPRLGGSPATLVGEMGLTLVVIARRPTRRLITAAQPPVHTVAPSAARTHTLPVSSDRARMRSARWPFRGSDRHR